MCDSQTNVMRVTPSAMYGLDSRATERPPASRQRRQLPVELALSLVGHAQTFQVLDFGLSPKPPPVSPSRSAAFVCTRLVLTNLTRTTPSSPTLTIWSRGLGLEHLGDGTACARRGLGWRGGRGRPAVSRRPSRQARRQAGSLLSRPHSWPRRRSRSRLGCRAARRTPRSRWAPVNRLGVAPRPELQAKQFIMQQSRPLGHRPTVPCPRDFLMAMDKP